MPRYTPLRPLPFRMFSGLAWLFRSPRQRRYLLPTIIALIIIYTYTNIDIRIPSSRPASRENIRAESGGYQWPGWPEQQVGRQRASWGALRQVGAKAKIKENLWPDKKYLIAFSLSGWNNQVIDLLNLIHLAVKSNRIPVVTPFYPYFAHYDAVRINDLPFGRIFDLKRLSMALGDRPIVEAHELKQFWRMDKRHAAVIYDGEVEQAGVTNGSRIPPEDWGPKDEDLGCWSFYGNFGGEGAAPMDRVALNLIYTPLPSTLFPGGTNTFPCSFPAAAKLLRTPHTSIPPDSQTTLDQYPALVPPSILPDDHLACVDSLYWLQEEPTVTDLHGEWHKGIGAWASVGRFTRFREELHELADAALGDLFGLKEGDEIPPFIGLHIRRGDFASYWLSLTPRHYAYIVQSVRQSIFEEHGVKVNRVVVSTDEKDASWLAELRSFGWQLTQDFVAWKATAADDEWLPLVLDSVILSRGIGFVGPASSTMSILSYLRVKDWNHGVAKFIFAHDKVPDQWSWSWDLGNA